MRDAEPFAAFMQRALFDPRAGYYSRRIKNVGARGDFSTSASVSAHLGQAIAAWLASQSTALPEVRTIIEIGGGDGSLMATVRKQTGWWRRRRLQFSLVETSPVLEAQQRQKLGDTVHWFRDLADALDAAGGHAFIFHNELFDALPVTLVQWDVSLAAWREVWLERHDGGCIEHLAPLASGVLSGISLSALDKWTAQSPPPAPRQRCELHTGIATWLAGWLPHWKAGSMLSIDYGDTFPELYHRRPRGTLRAYLLHQVLQGTDVYANAGRQDITADVNFTDVRRWLAEAGCTEISFETQRAFIARHPGGRPQPERAAGHFVSDVEGAGSAYKCLAVRRVRR